MGDWSMYFKRRMSKSTSIVQELSIGMTGIMTGFFIFVLILFLRNGYHQIIEISTANALSTLKLISNRMESLFSNAESYANIIIANGDVQSHVSSVSLEERIQSRPETISIMDFFTYADNLHSSMYIYTQNGDTIATGLVDNSKLNRHLPSLKENYQSLIENSQTAMLWKDTHPVDYLYSNRRNCVSLNKLIFSTKSGLPIGYLTLDIPEESFSNLYSDVWMQNIIVLNRDGQTVSCPDSSRMYENWFETLPIDWFISNDMSSQILQVNGKNSLVCCSTSGPNGWLIISILPIDDLIFSSPGFLVSVVLILCLAFATSVILIIRVSHSITDRISNLTNIMDGITQNIREVPDFPLDSFKDDEIGRLAHHFHEMILRLQAMTVKSEESHRLQREYELMALQAQINPHFLYNSLDSICALIILRESDQALQLVKDLGLFYRSVLGTRTTVITVANEFEITRRYLSILKTRYRDEIDFIIDCQKDIEQCSIIKLSLQPLVENAVYHGIKNKVATGTILIQGYRDHDKAVIIVADNGTGMKGEIVERILEPTSNRDEKPHFGIWSVHERIQLQFGSQYGLKINTTPGQGTTVMIILPYMSDIGNDGVTMM